MFHSGGTVQSSAGVPEATSLIVERNDPVDDLERLADAVAGDAPTDREQFDTEVAHLVDECARRLGPAPIGNHRRSMALPPDGAFDDQQRAMNSRVVCPTLHAEALHDDRVWELVRKTLARSEMRWTLFVEPLRARIDQIDIGPRLAWLAGEGHEIGMHTHHYRLLGPPGATTGFDKTIDGVSHDELVRGLRECWEYLVERGHRPHGFVAGGWLTLEPVFAWLAAHGFDYDCSLRTYAPTRAGSTWSPGVTSSAAARIGALVEIPTTTTLGTLRTAEAATPGVDSGVDWAYRHGRGLLPPRLRLAGATLPSGGGEDRKARTPRLERDGW